MTTTDRHDPRQAPAGNGDPAGGMPAPAASPPNGPSPQTSGRIASFDRDGSGPGNGQVRETLPLHDLPFDQYNRHTLVQRAVDALRGTPGRRLAILDVGGYPCWTPRFLPHDDVTVLDVQGGPDVCDRFVLGDGANLPFRDRSFDIVVTLDSLEHVPRAHREAFLTELTRVARDYVLLTAPFFQPEVRLAEDLLYEFIRATLKARHDQLAEHIEFDLPRVQEVAFDALGLRHARLPSGNVYNWLAMMIAKHHVMTIPGADTLHTTLDRFYNLTFFEADQREPAYRQLFLVAVGGDPAAMARFVASQISPAADGVEGVRRLELAQLLIKLLDLKLTNHADPRLVEQIEVRDIQISDLTAGLEEARAVIASRDSDIAALQASLYDYQRDVDIHRRETRTLREQIMALHDKLQEKDDEIVEREVAIERERIMLTARDRDVEVLNAHIHHIANGRVMRTLTRLQRKLG